MKPTSTQQNEICTYAIVLLINFQISTSKIMFLARKQKKMRLIKRDMIQHIKHFSSEMSTDSSTFTLCNY